MLSNVCLRWSLARPLVRPFVATLFVPAIVCLRQAIIRNSWIIAIDNFKYQLLCIYIFTSLSFVPLHVVAFYVRFYGWIPPWCFPNTCTFVIYSWSLNISSDNSRYEMISAPGYTHVVLGTVPRAHFSVALFRVVLRSTWCTPVVWYSIVLYVFNSFSFSFRISPICSKPEPTQSPQQHGSCINILNILHFVR